ncbi:condensation domain-containing protein [Ruegeria marina]|uniref:Thioesterase domain-containing protein n=1 Tax=Ruegeria marina TaxID=639004 RepID=A0A1G6IAZ3_9RHOB|nr:condensation domain-containing protein [Ruegeria marina]SDC03664.1 Thioesterase domain-containing protein [Ruegeria marina]
MVDINALSSDDVVGTFPTSITQKRAWFMDQIHPGNRGLNIAVRWELRGPVSSDAVEAAFQKIVDRHEVFRTRFVERDGEPLQEVMRRVEFKLNRLDIRNLPEAARDEKLRQIAREHAEEPFDLSEAGLLRVAMVRIETQRAALLISVHNSVFDGYSIGVLGHELGSFLAAKEEGKPADLPELQLQYGDFAMWQADYEASGAFAEDEEYWRQTLEGMRYFELPPDRPRRAKEPESRSFAADLPADFETRLAETAKALETSVFALGTAAFGIALERISSRRDVSFAIQVAGRNEVDLEPLIGIFTNPIVLRFDVDPDASLSDHAKRTRDVVNGALAHQTLPFDRLVQVLNPPRDPLRIPLVSIMFNLQRAFLKERTYGSVELVSVQSHSPGTLYDLNVNIVGRNAGWRMVIDYNADLFDEVTIERLSKLVVEVFDGLMHRVETRIHEIDSGVPDVRAELVGELVPPEIRARPAAEPAERQSEVVSRLREIWSEVLALPAEKVTGNFFDLGGYSVLALRMLSKVGECFGVRPSLNAFLAEPTVEGLAALLEKAQPLAAPQKALESQPGAIWDLFELRKSSTGAPVLITVNQPFMYQALARQMTSDCAVASLNVPGMAQLNTLEQAGFDKAVDEALSPVLERYSGRPLMLCGLCVDGRVALRLAQRLKDKGQTVSCVAMIDTWAPGAIKAFSAFERGLDRWRIRLRRLRYYLGLRRQGEIGWGDVLRQNDFAAKLLSMFSRSPAKDETAILVDATVDRLVEQTKAYTFAHYDGEVALFVTRSQGMVPRDGVLGWSDLLLPDVAVFPVNGWHGDALMRSGFGRIIGVLDVKAARLNAVRTSDE